MVPDAMEWSELQSEFEWDGSLRDIYILNTTLADWRSAIRALSESGLPLSFKTQGAMSSLPADVADVFDSSDGLLSVDLDGMLLNSHFFGTDEIEFDLDPREVTTGDRATALAGFLAILGTATGKPVILTRENAREAIILQWNPPEIPTS